MSQTQVQLAEINNLPCGTVRMYLFHDSSIPSLSYPTKVNILSVDDFSESIDIQAGIVEIESGTITIAEDYTDYAEGFWYKLINGYPDYSIEIMFTTVNDGTEMFMFRGYLFRQETVFREYYLDDPNDPTAWVRGLDIKLISHLYALKDVSVDSLITECMSYVTFNELDSGFITFGDIISAMIVCAYAETDDSNLCVCNATDIVLGTNTVFTEAYLGVYESATTPKGAFGDYSYSWKNRFGTAFDVLQHICTIFCAVPRIIYGTTTGEISTTLTDNKTRIVINSRGRGNSTITIPAGVIASEMLLNSPLMVKNIKAEEYITASATTPQTYTYAEGIYARGVPDEQRHLKFDIEYTCDYIVTTTPASVLDWLVMGDAGWFYLWPAVPEDITTEKAFEVVKYWDYSTGAYVTKNAPSNYSTLNLANNLVQSGVEYLQHRLAEGRIQYTRTYGGISANDGVTVSPYNLQTLQRHVISDGVTTRNFYASEVRKNIMTNQSVITWVEEGMV